MDGLTAEQIKDMRKHYIKLALMARNHQKNKEYSSNSISFWATTKGTYLIAARQMKTFWPLICGVTK